MRRSGLSFSLLKTRLVMLWERLYAGLIPILIVFGVFAGLALFGIFDALPGWLHVAALINFAALMLWAIIVAEPHLFMPRREEVRRRLEEDSSLPRGSLADLEDQPFAGDPASPLWQIHQRQLRSRLASLKTGAPHALVDKTDPYALRIPAVLLLLTGLLVAGPAAKDRLFASVTPSFSDRGPVTADIWIEPPDYTRQPPRFLLREARLPSTPNDTLSVPAGSVLHVRASRPGGNAPEVEIITAVTTDDAAVPDGNTRTPGTLTAPLMESGPVRIRIGRSDITYPVEIVPDTPPTVRLLGEPEVEGGVRTRLTIQIEDDYGVTDGAVELRLAANLRRPPDAPPITGPMPPALIDAPALRGEPGTREVGLDLTEHPWAGLPVSLRVRIKDGAGQEAVSNATTIVLPERSFYNPLSRVVIEERQNLALAPQSWQRSLRMFDALTLSPELFASDAKEYLLLRTAFHEIEDGRGRNVNDLVEVFWPLAIALEDEGLTLARQRLEAAQEALREALARGAPADEIDQLVDELRQAMADYLAALAASEDALAEEGGTDDVLEGQDLNDILDEIAALRRQGDSAAARARLAELEQMLQNLRISPGGGGSGQSAGGQSQSGDGDGEPGDGQEGTLGDAGDLIDQQRRMADETFSARRGDRTQQGLRDTQRALADAARQLGDAASAEGSAGTAAFDQAAAMMEGAARALERGDLASAGQAQERALGYLREGASALAEEALARENQGGEGDGMAADQGGTSGQAANRDPLGRIFQSQGASGVEIPDLTDPARIRALTRELRERLEDPRLPEEERQYLERLLRRF